MGKSLEINEFWVDCRELNPIIGQLKVHIVGPHRGAAHLDIIDNKNGTYYVHYKPTGPGEYKMDIKIAEEHIPGSPFKVKVSDFVSAIH